MRPLLALLIGLSSAVAQAEPSQTASTEVSFKPGDGLTVRSGDGAHRLSISTRVQARYTLEHEADPGVVDEISHGFGIRRARLKFTGHLFGEHNTFKLELGLSPNDMGFKDGVVTRTPILDAVVGFTYLRDLQVHLGQMKVPWGRHYMTSSSKLSLVDRSAAHSEFTLDRDVGIKFSSKNLGGVGHLAYQAGVFFGEGRDAWAPSDLGMLYTLRIEVMPFGPINAYIEDDPGRSAIPRLVLAAGYAHLSMGKRDRGIKGSVPSDGGTTATHNVHADAMIKWSGVTVDLALYWRRGVRSPGSAVDDQGRSDSVAPPRNGLGYHIQGNGFLGRLPINLAARYSRTVGEPGSSLTSTHSLGGGLCYQPGGHAFKFNADVFRSWDDSILSGDTQVRLQVQATL